MREQRLLFVVSAWHLNKTDLIEYKPHATIMVPMKKWLYIELY